MTKHAMLVQNFKALGFFVSSASAGGCSFAELLETLLREPIDDNDEDEEEEDKDEDNRNRRYLKSLQKLRPDAWKIDNDEKTLIVVEVEDSAPVKRDRLAAYCDLWFLFDCHPYWYFKLFVIDVRDQQLRELPLADLFYEQLAERPILLGDEILHRIKERFG